MQVTSKAVGMSKSLLRPMSMVGEKARERKGCSGYQYQCCRNNTKPAMAFCLRLPSLVVSEIVALRPAALMIP